MTVASIDRRRGQAYRNWPWPGLLLLIGALSALLWLLFYQRHLEHHRVNWEKRMAQLESQSGGQLRPSHPIGRRDAQQRLLEVRNARLVKRQLGLPWGSLLQAVEASASPSLALLAIRPDSRKGTLAISGEARHLDGVLEFVRRLGSHAVFRRVLLQSHRLEPGDTRRPVRFSLVADLAEASP
jgi:hypothetical protein